MEKKSHLNAYVTKRKMADLMREAKHANIRYKEGRPIHALDGVPISIKDNMFIEGMQASAASRALEGFIASVDSTTTSRLLSKGAICMGTANMDEFGMGSYGQ
jgi:aspartyl-tRNA(Asn)/glutamyl-tRNA(Gln) amidotransferase subunit A